MKIEEGKYYRTAGGYKVGPMIKVADTDVAFKGVCDGDTRLFQNDGRHGTGHIRNKPSYDIMAEWKDGPVRTVTHKEIVPDLYGIVRLSGVITTSKEVNLRIESGWHSINAISDAIETLTEIRDALQEQDK